MSQCESHFRGNYVSLEQRRLFLADVVWSEGVIRSITECGDESSVHGYLIPGFIDAHVHIESAMLPPSEFGRLALCHGTIGCVADPHEIANVLGMEGVEFMLDNARQSPFKAFFGAPSCVPATPFETSGGAISCAEIGRLLAEPEVCCLSEMMNFPGVLSDAPEVLAKLDAARGKGFPVDGHAPGVRGEAAIAYAAAGITTDHECVDLDEAREKIAAGMSILIREGSAAKNFAALHPLITEATARVMLCSDDKHPDDLIAGHINQLAARAVAAGHSIFDLLQVASINPIDHYRLPLGKLRVGDPMDAVEVSDLIDFQVLRTWLDGVVVNEQGRSCLPPLKVPTPNIFDAGKVVPEAMMIAATGGRVRVITVEDGSLLTGEALLEPLVEKGCVVADTERDILPICVINRYQPTKPALGFVQGFGLKRGAIASSVAHDSHNVIAIGADIEALCKVINRVIESRGGVAVMAGEGVDILPLPIAGIMSDQEGTRVGEEYARLDHLAKSLGSALTAPFMTLSFMALLVIPELKLSDKGLFDGRTFQFTDLMV
ncbi:MAG: adenine deaminase [Sedimenticola sp.]